MKHMPATHTDFIIEREFAAPPEVVFRAWADPELKRAWSDCHADHTTAYSLDFRTLGREHHEVRFPDAYAVQGHGIYTSGPFIRDSASGTLVDFDADGKLDYVFADPALGTRLVRGR